MQVKAKIAKLSLHTRNNYIIENIRGKFISLAGRQTDMPGNRPHAFKKVNPVDPATEGESLDAKLKKVQEAMKKVW